MPARTGAAHVVTTTRKYKDQVYRTHLLRRSYRENGVVKNETLGNLSHLPDALIEVLRRSLRGVHRAQFFLKGTSRKAMREALQLALARKQTLARRLSVDVDPL